MTEERTPEGLGLKEGGNLIWLSFLYCQTREKAVKEVSTEEVAKRLNLLIGTMSIHREKF